MEQVGLIQDMLSVSYKCCATNLFVNSKVTSVDLRGLVDSVDWQAARTPRISVQVFQRAQYFLPVRNAEKHNAHIPFLITSVTSVHLF